MIIASILVGVSVTLIAFLFDKYFIKIYDYWKKQGIPCVKGALPFVGNSLSILSFRRSLSEFCRDVYNANPECSMIGFFQFRQPTLVLRDPELIKTVLISNFTNFHHNVATVDPDLDPLAARNPFFSFGDQWKIERSRLSNALMSAKKLKLLCGAVTNVCKKFTGYLDENVKRFNGIYEAESKDLFSRFTGEVVASAGFGVEGDFFSNGSGPNSFRETVDGVFEPTFLNTITQTLLIIAPVTNKFLRNSFVPKHVDRFFRRVIHQMILFRSKQDIACNDFLQEMLDAQRKNGGEIDEFGITASATAFFLDGYETSAITLGFFAYQVAANPHVQDKLRGEVITVLKRHNGEITYESLSEMTYMDQALNESMRLCPSLSFLAKRATRQLRLVGNDGIECLVEPGTELIVSVQALHNDPDYWTNPEIYDPERFADGNKNDRPRTVFIPFGEGPRICVGMRFGVMQIKAAMATMLRSYRIEVSSKMKLPFKLKRTAFLSAAEGGVWIKFKPI